MVPDDTVRAVLVYAGMDPTTPLREVGTHAQRVERLGYDGLALAETVQDGFMLALLALETRPGCR